LKQIDISIKEYIQGYGKEIQNRLYRIREIIFEQVPTAEEGIKYKMPTVVYHGNLIHYAAFKNHIGIYPLPEVIETLKEELKAFRQGKGSIQFQNNEELPIELIKKIVKARVEEKENELLEKKNEKQENNKKHPTPASTL